MNDPDQMLREVITRAISLGIPVPAETIDPTVRINHRATGRFGRCIRQSDGRMAIELSSRLLEAPEGSCRAILSHEVLHACEGCQNHQALWRSYAERLGTAYGCRILRTVSCEDLQLAAPIARYLVVCTRCGAKFPRARRSALVQYPGHFRCKCGGTLERRIPSDE